MQKSVLDRCAVEASTGDLPCTPDELRPIGLFGALNDDILTYFCSLLTLSHCNANEELFVEGDEARAMYVVLTGELEVVKHSKQGHEVRVALLGIHDWVGEISLLDIHPRASTVRALTRSRLLRITTADLDTLYRRDSKAYALVILNMARELARRLRVTDGILTDFLGDVTDTYVLRRSPPRAYPLK